MPATQSVDVLIPVHNSLDHVRECINSVLRTREDNVRVIVVDDGSAPPTRDWLSDRLTDVENVVLIRNEEGSGYLRAILTAISHATSDLLVMLNSDTLLFPRFFDRIRWIMDSDPEIGILNPVSVWANWTRIPFPSGHTVFSMAEKLEQQHGDTVTDIYNACGFCLIMRRDLLESVGGFDIKFDPGYWEETDLCMRVLAAGHRVVVAPGLFVFHHGWGSFGEDSRNEHMARNERIFRAQWGDEYERHEVWYQLNDPIRQLKGQLARNDGATDNVFTAAGASANLKVLYLLPQIKLYGGVISVIQVVNRLVMQGISANIAVLGSFDPATLRYAASYLNPMIFANEDDFLNRCPPVDVLVATHWSTVYPVVKQIATGVAKHAAYFVQDYEPDFHAEGSIEARMAEQSYFLIKDRIVKTPWLKDKLARFGGTTTIIPLGLNRDVFVDYDRPRRPMVVAMARPSSPRRNWEMIKRCFLLLHKLRPDIELAVYGFGFKNDELPPGVTSYGLLSTAADVAKVLNQAKVLLDPSTYQGFGRPGLEAMACGVVPVVTKNGGITSYAKHMVNCLLIDPFDLPGMTKSIISLMDDADLYARLKSAAQSTLEPFSIYLEGDVTEELFRVLADKPTITELAA